MNTVENQKIIIVSKAPADKQHPYTTINIEAIDHAAIHLKANAFKLWMYIAKNQNKYKFGLSQVAFCHWSGVSKPTYLTAVRDLIDQGYLVKSNQDSGNCYIFYELPTEKNFPETKEDLKIKVPEAKVIEIETANKQGFIF